MPEPRGNVGVLVCQGCGHEFEPQPGDLHEVEQLVTDGCPQCGDWLFFTELVTAAGGDGR